MKASLLSLLVFLAPALAQASTSALNTIQIVTADEGGGFLVSTVGSEECNATPDEVLKAMTTPSWLRTSCSTDRPQLLQINAAFCAKLSAFDFEGGGRFKPEVSYGVAIDLNGCGELAENESFKTAIASAIEQNFKNSGIKLLTYAFKGRSK